MTDYTKTTNFATKDALPSGNANKIVKGTEINTEFDNIATAVTTKSNIASPTFTGVVSFPDGSASDPSITNTGDTNVGLFFSAGDTLAFTAGGTSQFTMADGVIAPVTDSDVDLGTSSLYFKNAYIDSVTTTGNITIGGNLDVDGTLEFDSLSGTGTIAVTDILDQDDMSGDSATALATQQSIKAYVDAQQDTVDTFGEVLALSNTTAGTDIAVSTDDKVQFRDSAIYINSSADGQLDIVADTEIQIAATTVDINGAVALNGAITGATNVTLSGELDAATGDFSGAVDIDGALDVAGTTNLDVVDIDGATQIDATVSVGVDDTGYDVKFFGATSGKSLLWDESADSLIVTGTTTMTGDSTVSGTLGVTGVLTGTSLDISGDVDVDGTLEADAITVNGTALNTVIAGVTVNNASTAAVATTVTITDNESTDESNALIFTAGGDVDGGNLGLESDGTLTYNPSTGVVTATGFAGTLTGNVTGNVSGTAATVTGAAQGNITSLGTLTSLDISGDATVGDDLSLDSDAAVLGFGTDTDTTLTHVADTGILLNSTRQLQFGDSGTYIHQSADGVLDLVSDTEIEINATTIDINGNTDISGTVTATGTSVFASLDISGDIDVDGTTNLDVVDIDGAVDMASTLAVAGAATFTGAITANAGVVVDNISIDGSTITVGSASDLTVDAVGNIILDSDSGFIKFKDNGTEIGSISLSGSDISIISAVSDEDIIFKGNDGGSTITALTLDMSAAGAATFNAGVTTGGLIKLGGTGTDNDSHAINFVNGACAIARDNNDLELHGYNAISFGVSNTSYPSTTERFRIAADGSLSTPTAGTSNVRFGVNAGNSIASGGNYNVVVGDEAGTAITTGDNNVAVGYNALTANTTASNNTAVGKDALGANTTGSENTAVGNKALKANTTGAYNHAFGHESLDANTTGIENNAFGLISLSTNTEGNYNTAYGSRSLSADTLGSRSVAIGYSALTLQNFTSAANANNTAVGSEAGKAVTTGYENTFVGAEAGDGTDDGYGNVAVGFQALSGNCGIGNVAVGKQSGRTVTGSSNTVIGNAAGYEVTSGSNNTFLGNDAGRTGSPGGAITTASNILSLGDENVATANIQVDWTVASDARDKTDFTALDLGLNFVNDLQPVTYKWDKRSKYGDKTAEDYDLNAQTPDGTHKEDWLDIGFKAQEVEALEIAAGYNKDNNTNLVSSHSGDGKQMGLQYSKFVPILVKAIQEQQALIESLTARIETLEG
jgi:cytoskeletal protein CcmA (bactofilin family)